MPVRAVRPSLRVAATFALLTFGTTGPLTAQTQLPFTPQSAAAANAPPAAPEPPGHTETAKAMSADHAPTRATPSGGLVFPASISAKYASQTPGRARLHTCLDQYRANKAIHGNGGLQWIQSGGGYYSQCLKKLKA